MPTPRRDFAVGALLIAGALLLFFSAGLGGRDAFTLPVPTDGRWVEGGPFRVSRSSSYRAALLLDRRFPFREMECLADVGTPSPTSSAPGRRTDCPAGFEPSGFEFELLEKGGPVPLGYSFGAHAGEYDGKAVGRSLGIYRLTAWRGYRVRARFVEPSPKLAGLTPRVQVAVDDTASLAVEAWAASLVSAGLLGFGAVFVGRGLRRRLN